MFVNASVNEKVFGFYNESIKREPKIRGIKVVGLAESAANSAESKAKKKWPTARRERNR